MVSLTVAEPMPNQEMVIGGSWGHLVILPRLIYRKDIGKSLSSKNIGI